MNIREFNWKTKDQIDLYGCEWCADEARAVIGLIHGLGEHVRRYDHVGRFFNERGYGVVGYDRRGHGRSKGKRGHAPQYGVYLDEIAQLLIECERRYPDRPVFLYGHSMGGNLLLTYVLRRHPDVSGAIVTGPHIRLSFQPNSTSVALGRLLRRVMPGFTQGTGLVPDHVSRDARVVEAYNTDPLVHDRVTAATAIDMFQAAAYLDQYAGPVGVPLLLMHGGGDHITEARATEELAGRLEGDVTLKIWPELYHEIHNEPEQEEVLAYVAGWIEQHLNPEQAYRPLKSV